MPDKSPSIVVKAQEGESFWQPGIKGNCITIKVSPENVLQSNHTIFLHELPKGGEIPEHAHLKDTEIFICLDGEGIITIDSHDFRIEKHDIAYVAPLSKHRIRATSEIPLKCMVIVTPTGLEERFKLMGAVKKFINEAAPEAFISEISKKNTHGVL